MFANMTSRLTTEYLYGFKRLRRRTHADKEYTSKVDEDQCNIRWLPCVHRSTLIRAWSGNTESQPSIQPVRDPSDEWWHSSCNSFFECYLRLLFLQWENFLPRFSTKLISSVQFLVGWNSRWWGISNLKPLSKSRTSASLIPGSQDTVVASVELHKGTAVDTGEHS